MRREKITQVDKVLGQAVLDAAPDFPTPDVYEMLMHTYALAQERKKVRRECRRKVFVLAALAIFVTIAGMLIVSLVH